MAFSKKVNFMHMLSLIFSIQREEIHGNMHKCGKTYLKFAKSLQIRSDKYSALGFLDF